MTDSDFKEIIDILLQNHETLDLALQIPIPEQNIIQSLICDLITMLGHHQDKTINECMIHVLNINQDKIKSVFQEKFDFQIVMYAIQWTCNYLMIVLDSVKNNNNKKVYDKTDKNTIN